MTGINYTSSFILILSLSLISDLTSNSAIVSDATTVASTDSSDVSTTIDVTSTSEPSKTAELSTTPDVSTAGISGLTSGEPTATTVDSTESSDISTTIDVTSASEPSSTAETTITPDGSTTEVSGLTSGEPTATTVDSTDSSDISTTIDVTSTSEPSNTAELSTTPDVSTAGISGLTSGEPTTTTVDTTDTADISTTIDVTSTTEPSNTAETTNTQDVSTTGISGLTSGQSTATTVDTTDTSDITTSTQTTTKTTTVKPIVCYNGGTPQPNNLACSCPTGFTGRLCNTIETEIALPDIFERTVNITMEINELFTNDHQNPSSDAYKGFVERFTKTVVPIYQNKINEFTGVDNIVLSAGKPLQQRSQIRKRSLPLKETKSDASLKVEHDVLLEIVNNQDTDNKYENLVGGMDSVLDEIKSNSGFVVNEAIASKTDSREVCVKATEHFPAEYQKYFEPVLFDDKVTCVTQCNVAHNNRIICENGGTCEVSIEGPSCYCRYTDGFWYLGENCSLQVHKVGFYAGLGTVAAIAVITVAFLTAYLVMNKRTVKRNKDIKQELVKEWLEDDFEWPPQKKTSSTVDRYDNPVYSPGGIHKRDSFGKYKPDFSANQSYTQNFSPEHDINLRYLQRDQSMRVDRPQIRTSFDI